MKCSLCGGHVEWKGPLTNLTHTECSDCGGTNCQEVEEPADEETKLSVFRRLRNRFRAHCVEKMRLMAKIRELEYQIGNEKRKAAEAENRLKNIVNASAERCYGPRDIVRLSVDIDHGALIKNDNWVSFYKEAMHQLLESAKKELSSR